VTHIGLCRSRLSLSRTSPLSYSCPLEDTLLFLVSIWLYILLSCNTVDIAWRVITSLVHELYLQLESYGHILP
jgi:hypothetical protein